MGGTVGGDDAASDPATVATLPAQAPAFVAGELVAGRFRIVAFIARGGMAEVYEADDLLLGERVAIKTIRRDLATGAILVARFRREIQLARRVTHRNVCRIFEVGVHEGTAFVAMELLRGETLATLVRRRGRLAPAEALPLVAQMAAGLDAAHEAGVVHRDFKSANVILADDGRRVVVTDFGIARATASSKSDEGDAVTGAGALVGSPAYMAPEQVESGDVGPRADVYALGVVLYEMVTGKLPYAADTPLQTAVQRLRAPPPPPRSVVADVDPRWDAAILRCLAQDPADRFERGGDVVRALEAPMRQRRQWGLAIAVAAAAILALAVAMAARLRGPTTAPRPPPASVARPTVAVLGMKNLSGRDDAAWISVAATELLSTDLATGGKLRVVAAEHVGRMKRDLQLGEAETLASDSLQRVRRVIGADFVVVGSYLPSGDRLRLQLSVQDTRSGELVGGTSETGSPAELVELLSRAAQRLRPPLGATELSLAEEREAHALLPANSEAARLYAEGAARFNVAHDCAGARDQLEQAVAADPRYALAQSALSSVLYCVGDEARAREIAERARQLAAGLPQTEKLIIDANYHEVMEQLGPAIAARRALFELHPDNLEYGLQLAELLDGYSQINRRLGNWARSDPEKHAQAMQTVAALRRLPPPASEDPRIDLVEAGMGDQALALAERAETKARQRGQLGLVLEAKLRRAEFHARRRERADALHELFVARDLAMALGDRDAVATLLGIAAAARFRAGDADGARALGEEALANARTISSVRRIPPVLGGLIDVYVALGRVDEALAASSELLALTRTQGPREREAEVLMGHAYLQWIIGDFRVAREGCRQATDIVREVNRAGLEAESCHAMIDAFEGHTERAIATFRALLGPDPEAKTEDANDHRISLSMMLVEAGRVAEAEPLLRSTLTFEKEVRPAGPGPFESAMLARALVGQGRLDEARIVNLQALALAVTRSHYVARVIGRINAARILLATGDLDGAEREARAALEAATPARLQYRSFDARLALAEIGLRRDPQAARRALATLVKDARAKGFGLVVSKAEALMRR